MEWNLQLQVAKKHFQRLPLDFTGASARPRALSRFGKPHRSDFFRSLHMAIAAVRFLPVQLSRFTSGGVPSLWPDHNMAFWKINGKKVASFFFRKSNCEIVRMVSLLTFVCRTSVSAGGILSCSGWGLSQAPTRLGFRKEPAMVCTWLFRKSAFWWNNYVLIHYTQIRDI